MNIEPIQGGHKRRGKRRITDVHPLVIRLANRLSSQKSIWELSGDE